jgi:hypothetical protein
MPKSKSSPRRVHFEAPTSNLYRRALTYALKVGAVSFNPDGSYSVLDESKWSGIKSAYELSETA